MFPEHTCYNASKQLIMTNNPCINAGANRVNPTVVGLFNLYPYPNLFGNSFQFDFTSPTTIHFGQMRVDHNFSEKDSLFARYTIQDPYNTSANIYPQILLSSYGRDQFVTVGENHIFSPTLLNTVRLSFSRTNVQQDEVLTANLTSPTLSLVAGLPTGQVQITGINNFNNTNAPSRLLQNIYTLSEDLFYTRGKHAFKFGALFSNRYENFLNTPNGTRGTINFQGIAQFLTGVYSTGTYFTTYNGRQAAALLYHWVLRAG